MSTTDTRYRVGFTLKYPWIVDLVITNADTLTPEELKADMPRIEAALLKALDAAHQEKERQLTPTT